MTGKTTTTATSKDRLSQRADAFYGWIFGVLAGLVADYNRHIIVLGLLVTVVLSSGIHRIKPQHSVQDNYNPFGSPSRDEYARMEHFFSPTAKVFQLRFLLLDRDEKRGNMLQPPRAQQALQIVRNVQRAVGVQFGSHFYTYADLCESFCHSNLAVENFLNTVVNVPVEDQPLLTTLFKQTYPQMTAFGQAHYIGYNFLGTITNATVLSQDESALISAEAIFLRFHSTYSNATMKHLLDRWQWQVFEYLESINNQPNATVKVTYASPGLAEAETARGGRAVLPYLPLVLALIIVFSLVGNYTYLTTIRRQWVEYKPWLVLVGVVCPLLAAASSFGALIYVGVPFVGVNTIVPFLVLVVGVDDMFIALHSWHATDRWQTPRVRLRQCLSVAGPSITITSATNTLAFAIGAASPTPAIRSFCTYLSVAIALDYLYQMLLFSAALYISGVQEAKSDWRTDSSEKTSIEDINRRKLSTAVMTSLPEKQQSERLMGRHYSSICDWLERAADRMSASWIRLIIDYRVRIAVGCALIGYWCLALYGILTANVHLSEKQIFLEDSPMADYNRLAGQYEWMYANRLVLLFNQPLQLTNRSVQQRVYNLTKAIESLPESNGAVSTELWLPVYERFLRFFGLDHFSYKYIDEWLRAPDQQQWASFLKLNEAACVRDEDGCVQQFVVSTQFHGMHSLANWLPVVERRRALLAGYADLHVTQYDPLSMFADHLLLIRPSCVITVLTALFAMCWVCTLFMPQPLTVLTAMTCVLSINIGLFGFLMHWDTNLDPVSSMNIVLSIGLSVDFTAHISYHYYKAGHTLDLSQRLRVTFGGIAYPMVQSAVSTSLAALCMAPVAVHSYIVRVFVKNIVLVCALGLFHALMILPMLLVTMSQLSQRLQRVKHQVQPTADNAKVASASSSSTSQDNIQQSKDVENGSFQCDM